MTERQKPRTISPGLRDSLEYSVAELQAQLKIIIDDQRKCDAECSIIREKLIAVLDHCTNMGISCNRMALRIEKMERQGL